MSTAESHTLISVRGEAQRVVAADQASVVATVSAIADTKHDARIAVTQILEGVARALAELGGEVLTADNARAPLTWSTQSIRTNAEYGHDKITGSGGPTGRHIAEASLVVALRDFAPLGRLEAVLTTSDAVSLHQVQWSVDADNAEWALVRADAIDAALRKGQDYAAALGGAVSGVEHVADAGLLEGNTAGDRAFHATASRLSASPDAASLDPVPQVLRATIEARLRATITSRNQ